MENESEKVRVSQSVPNLRARLCRQQDDDAAVQLTPEQQKQLALIESMPLTTETEVSQEEWEMKTPEERERIMGERIMGQSGAAGAARVSPLRKTEFRFFVLVETSRSSVNVKL